MGTVTRSPADPTDRATLERLKLSPEVAWYLASRGIPFPDCPPAIKTPEPGGLLRNAKFDAARVDRVLSAFGKLRHTKGKWAGQPLKPDPWQVAYILAPVFGWVRFDRDARKWVRVIRELYVDVPRKNGKGLYTGTMILTRDGWKQFGDIRPGDQVHSIDGSLTRVTWTSPVRHLACYRVSFADGQSVVCDADHLWTVWDRYGHDPAEWAASRRQGAWRTVATPELAVTDRAGARRDTRYAVRTDRVLDREPNDLPVDPYLLGLWLGDGHTDAARITTIDDAIWQAFETRSPWTVRRVPGTVSFSITGGFRVSLRTLGVLGDKHVPETYLLGSESQRLDLLRGLMDTDGSVIVGPNTPRVEFTSTRRVLAEAVLFLARSLGWKSTIIEGRAMLDGRDCGPKWRVMWTAFSDRSPFALDRKTRRLHAESDRRTRASTNTIVSVEEVDSVPTMCIAVEHESHQFLVGDGLIPTHNSTTLGGIGIYMTAADGEQGAEVVAAATTKDQAKFVFAPVKALAEKAPALKGHVKAFASRIVHESSGSYFEVISSVADAQHGASIHCAVIDELHVHKSAEMVETIETGTGSRDQPLVACITTADDGRPGTIYARKRRRIEELARRVITDASTYGVIWCAEKSDDPFVEATWRAANPGFGISPTRSYMAKEALKAQQDPAELGKFLRLHLGIRTKQTTRYIDLADWDASAGMVDEAALAGRACHGGLDLASVEDVTAFSLAFPSPDGSYDALWRFWLPEDRLPALSKRTAGESDVWVREGWLRTTPGNVVDNDEIVRQIVADGSRFQLKTVAFDRWGATDVTRRLMDDGLDCVPTGQGYQSMTGPLKEMLRLVKQQRLRHGGNPVMRWMVDNLAVDIDSAANVKPAKDKASDKIDGVPALAMALRECMAELAEVPTPARVYGFR